MAFESPRLEIPALDFPVPEGPALEGPALEGPALEAPVLEAPAIEVPAHETPLDTPSRHWLCHYGNATDFQWQKLQRGERTTFHRPLGFLEFAYDGEGRHYEGQGDISNTVELKIKSSLTQHAFRARVLLAWACLRCQHPLLRAYSKKDLSSDQSSSFAPYGMHFLVDALNDVQQATDHASQHIVFLEDHFDHVDPLDFFYHCQNSARILNPEKSLSKAFVFPIQKTEGVTTLRMLIVGAHSVWDGLTVYNWDRDFVRLLNDPVSTIAAKMTPKLGSEFLATTLPLPQEALYPAIAGSVARQRWFWAIVRVLRHVRRPLRPSIPNPLLRRGPPVLPSPLAPKYQSVLTYDHSSARTTRIFEVNIPMPATRRLHRVCREVGASVGAGCFALVNLVSMEMHEALLAADGDRKAVEEEQRDFITGFPLDVRGLVTDGAPPECVMLAHSDGLSLPFLSTSVDLGTRLRALTRRAHVELSAYQKKRKGKVSDDQARQHMLCSRGAGLVLANQYLRGWERVEHILPWCDVQGEYPVRKNPTSYVHRVSSVGRRNAILSSGKYRLDDPDKDFIADCVDAKISIRAREGFLVVIEGTENGTWVRAVADMTLIDPVLAERWQTRIAHILDDLDDMEGPKL